MIEIKISDKDIFNIKNYLPNDSEMSKLLEILAKKFIEKFIENIEAHQQNWDGTEITQNSKRWRERKQKEGADLRSLVYREYDFLKNQNWSINVNGNNLKVSMKKPLKDKFYDVKDIGKDYEFVMPNPNVEQNMEWFENTLAKLIEKKIIQKMGR
jgi:mRNA-degrading endonuclease HigB of HigAB toxin-antitoxin module